MQHPLTGDRKNNMQFRLTNSQWYLFNANPDANHSANPTKLNGNRNNPNPTNHTKANLPNRYSSVC